MATVTSTPSFSSLSISGTTNRTGNISWSKPTVPSGATIISCILSGTLNISMSRGSATVTINGTTRTAGAFSINLGTSNTTTSVAVTARGNNKNASGTVSMSNLVYTVTYEYSIDSISTSVSEINLKVGESTTFIATSYPTETSGNNISATSSISGVSISKSSYSNNTATFRVNATSAGTGIIRLFDTNNSSVILATISVTVENEDNIFLGTTFLSEVYIGNTKVTEIYIGNTKIL